MGHGKLRKFAENAGFRCLIQPEAGAVISHAADGSFLLKEHPVKGRWNTDIFAKPQPIVLELGCGRGEYTIALAQRDPSRNYIGVDIKGARLWKGAKYAEENKLGNVAFLRTRIEFIEAFFAREEVSEIWLTFSDPQLHAENNRLTSPRFLGRYRSFLSPGGRVNLKTDSTFLYEYSLAVARKNGLRIFSATPDLYSTPPSALVAASGVVPVAASEESSVAASGVVPGVSSEVSSVSAFDLSPEAVRALYEVQTYYESMFLSQGIKIKFLAFGLDHEGAFLSPDKSEFDPEYWLAVEGPRRTFGHNPAPSASTSEK